MNNHTDTHLDQPAAQTAFRPKSGRRRHCPKRLAKAIIVAATAVAASAGTQVLSSSTTEAASLYTGAWASSTFSCGDFYVTVNTSYNPQMTHRRIWVYSANGWVAYEWMKLNRETARWRVPSSKGRAWVYVEYAQQTATGYLYTGEFRVERAAMHRLVNQVHAR